MEEQIRGTVPRKIRGFRDIDPKMNLLRWKIVNAAAKIYQSFGFEHWDTPILEFADCLGKYMPDSDTVEQGVYSFKNPEQDPVFDNKGKEMRTIDNDVVMENHFLSLRYDLTAPLARNYAERLWLLNLRGQVSASNPPLFRRYQFGPVFRYEAKLDPGRFREFWQVDFDTVGTADVAADAEVCIVLTKALEEIGLKKDSFFVKVNNRKILSGFLESVGVNDKTEEKNILRIIDKVDKIGIEGVALELGKGREEKSGAFIEGLGLPAEMILSITNFFGLFSQRFSREEVLEKLAQIINNNLLANEGVQELHKMNLMFKALNFDDSQIVFDPTLVRGMAYYTGPIFEVESLMTYKDSKGTSRKVGSICGGGRYDGLVENLLGLKVPATGASIGVDRLAELLTLAENDKTEAFGAVLIAVFDDSAMNEYQKIAAELRNAGINAEVYYGAGKNLKKQFAYADKKNSPIVIMAGEDEMLRNSVTIKDLVLGKQMDNIQNKEEWRAKVQFEVSRNEMVQKVKEILNR